MFISQITTSFGVDAFVNENYTPTNSGNTYFCISLIGDKSLFFTLWESAVNVVCNQRRFVETQCTENELPNNKIFKSCEVTCLK